MYWKELVEVQNFGFNAITISAIIIVIFSYFVYGIFTKEAAIIINGLASLFVVPIVVGLWRFKGFSKIDFFVFLLCVLGFVVMLIFPFKKIMFLLFSFGSILALIAQLVEMHKTKAVGVIEIKLIRVYLVSTAVFVVYSIFVNDWPLLIISVLSFILLVIILLSYYRFMAGSTFNDIRSTTYYNRIKIGFSSLVKKWKGSEAVFTEHTLEIEGHPVMEDWEDGYMKELAEIACMNGGDILEVGFGMGISSGYIHKHDILSHTVIEANEDVYKRLVMFSFIAKHIIKPLFGFWQEITKFIPSETFDGILFDTYPITKEEIHKNHFPFFCEAFRLLKDGGVLTYYSDEIDSFSEEHINCLRRAGFTDIQSMVCVVNPPQDCKYWKSDRILAPIIFKGRKGGE